MTTPTLPSLSSPASDENSPTCPDVSVIRDDPVSSPPSPPSPTSLTSPPSPSPSNSLETTDQSPTCTIGKRLASGFMTPDELLNTVRNENADYTSVPNGIKNNVYFVLQNEVNKNRRGKGAKSTYNDDCGVWDSKTTSTKLTYYISVCGKLVYVVKKGGLYGKIVKGSFVPIEPQPSEVINLKRYYATLKRDPSYKKNVSWFEVLPNNVPTEKSSIAIAEYVGTFPTNISTHGNAIKSSSEYVRSSQQTIENIRSKVSTDTSRKVYTDLVLNDSATAPRDFRQVQNVKYKLTSDPTTNKRNNADDIQTLLSIMHDHEFIQVVIQEKGKPPSVILYTKPQLTDLSICISPDNRHQSVLGVDGTFNLGACFVTLFVYKNPKINRRSTQEPAILVGPMYLHWDGAFTTYHRFFSHLQSRLMSGVDCTEVGYSNLIVGSDEEKALTKALQQCFQGSTLLLCTRHLQENVARYLQSKCGVPESQRRTIISDIFGRDGLLSADLSNLAAPITLPRQHLDNILIRNLFPNFVTTYCSHNYQIQTSHYARLTTTVRA